MNMLTHAERMPAHHALPLHLAGLALHAGGRSSGRVLIQRLDLQIDAGQRWVLLGPNGAGKSTLLLALAGLLPPHAGRIQLDGRALADWPATGLAMQRAWCPQFWLDPFPVSAWETVASALIATHPELDADTAESSARHWLAELDVATLAEHDVRSLSGGERQRVAIATACAQRAPILLLDEPTAHLDWSHQATLAALLKRWSGAGGSVIAALHDLNLAWSYATHALLLDGRGGALHGPREEILQPTHLEAAYGVPVSMLEDGAGRWFRVELEKPA